MWWWGCEKIKIAKLTQQILIDQLARQRKKKKRLQIFFIAFSWFKFFFSSFYRCKNHFCCYCCKWIDVCLLLLALFLLILYVLFLVFSLILFTWHHSFIRFLSLRTEREQETSVSLSRMIPWISVNPYTNAPPFLHWSQSNTWKMLGHSLDCCNQYSVRII